MKKFIGFTGLGAGALLPLLTAAQTVGTVGATILSIINTIVLIIMALAFLFFIVAVFKYIMAKEEKTKGAARDNMIYGIIGLFVMVAVWGLVRILVNTFGLGGGAITQCGDYPSSTFVLTACGTDTFGNPIPMTCNVLTNDWECSL